MENVTEALKIALGILVFVIGLTILFNMASLSKETSRIIISEIDKAKYYDYIEDAGEEKIDRNGNRIVKIEDIVPAIYRYSQENFGITIVDKDGKIVARFDSETEDVCNALGAGLTDYREFIFVKELQSIYEQVNDLANKIGKNQVNINLLKINTIPANPTGVGVENVEITNDDKIKDLFKRIYGQKILSSSSIIDYNCFWTASTDFIAYRINSDLSRT